jgi:endonuclease G, mitochondrial
MRKILLSTFLITLQLSAWANPIDDNCPQHTTLGAPVSSIKENTQYICHTNYAVHYRYDTKTAEFVVERLDRADITGPAKRKNNFGPDPKVDDAKEAQLDDYKGHPYDRGHLSPAADNRADDNQMSESFYLTNMVPQDPGHNRGIWRILEIAVRNTAMTNDIYVVSGTIYDPGFKTIGAGKVGVPSRIWKIVYNATNGETIAFLFPNAKLSTKDLPKYAVTVDEVEKATGINVFPKLDERVEARFDPAKWPEIFK